MIDYLGQLRIDIDRLEYYENRGNSEKVEEYKDLIVSHAKQLCQEQCNNQ